LPVRSQPLLALPRLRLVGQLLINLLALARAPHQGPWRDVSGHLYRIGATALPITALVGFLIGVVLAYLMSQQLRSSGPMPSSSTSWASR
jgi:phospholipid/cholesterol/gamma-HCH transport system permease protein